MEFFNSAVDTLQTIVVGLGGALCVWGGINLLEGYGQDILVSVQISKTCSSRNGLSSASVPGAVKTSMRARKTSTAGIVAVSS